MPVLWSKPFSRHSQMHAFFVARSAAAALGVIIAAALLAANVTGADLGRSFKLQVPEKRASVARLFRGGGGWGSRWSGGRGRRWLRIARTESKTPRRPVRVRPPQLVGCFHL